MFVMFVRMLGMPGTFTPDLSTKWVGWTGLAPTCWQEFTSDILGYFFITAGSRSYKMTMSTKWMGFEFIWGILSFFCIVRNCRQPQVYHKRIVSKSGKHGWQGGPDLWRSAIYPKQFCMALFRCWIEASIARRQAAGSDWWLPLVATFKNVPSRKLAFPVCWDVLHFLSSGWSTESCKRARGQTRVTSGNMQGDARDWKTWCL